MNRPVYQSFIWVIGLLCSCVGLKAGLQFESTELSLKPATGERKLSTQFKFKNTGDTAVSILRVDSGCGCTLPERPRDPIAPGAEGAVPVIYNGGDRQGRQQQAITVETSDGVVHELSLVVELPVRITFEPRLMLFRGAALSPLSAKVIYSDALPVELVDVTVLTPAFEVAETPALDGDVLKLSLRYVGDPAAESRGMVRIRTKDAAGKTNADLLYLRHTP